MVEQSPRFEELKIRLPKPVSGVEEISAVLGIPEWWPTGSRVAVAIAHSSAGNMDDPVITDIHRRLTEQKFLSLRFNFPFGEAGKRSGTDSAEVMDRTFRAALSVLGRDATQAPAHLILGGKGTGAAVAARLATARLRIAGLFFLGFPLHPAGKPSSERADHLAHVELPMLFLQGSRDKLAPLELLRPVCEKLGERANLHIVEAGDHSFHVLKRSGRTDDEALDELAEAIRGFADSLS